MSPFIVKVPSSARIPILLSVPHCGTDFPKDLKDQYKPAVINSPEDTDWFVDRLYDFAPGMGITMIIGTYSRWLVDLNRDPKSKPLYSDGRVITALCPTKTFLGEFLYKDERQEVPEQEVQNRLEKYYYPYHQKLQDLLDDLKVKFGKVLLWDCHSIKQHVPTIYKQKIPDLILGDAEGAAASPVLIENAFKNLSNSSYSLSHNYPFMGGFITRHYGNPLKNQHALQLEMTKINYMDETELHYNNPKADKIRKLLVKTLGALGEEILK